MIEYIVLCRRFLMLAAGAICFALPSCGVAIERLALAQTPVTPTGPAAFEVASIKPHRDGDDTQETNLLPGGRYVGINASVRKLIRLAFGVEDSQIVGAPGWIDSERYDIEAKTGETTQLEPPEFQRVLLALLEERFQLKFHTEMRERPAYWLVVQKSGAKLKVHAGTSEPSMKTNSVGAKRVLEATNISMKDLAGALTRQAGRITEDHTGLTGNFDVSLEWDINETTDSVVPSLFTALEEQLGLKLNPAKGQVEVIVVDHVERPSEN